MGTGWRKAFCTSIRRDTSESATRPQSPSPRSCSKLKLFSNSFNSSSNGGSNPVTPRPQTQQSDVVAPSPGLRCRTARLEEGNTNTNNKLQCRSGISSGSSSSGSPVPSPRPPLHSPASSNPCSPRSPSRFALLRNSLRSSRNRCGICLQSVKAVQGTAIFIAECSHSFHFPCIATHVRKQANLVCPVCATTWRQVPLLSLEPHALPEEEETTVEEPPREKEHDSGREWRTVLRQGKARVTAAENMTTAVAVAVSPKTNGYSDDEPLLSPGGGASRFNPIPEDEEEKSSDNEFQGFFAGNPSPPSPHGRPTGGERQQKQQQQQPQKHNAYVSTGNGVQISILPDVALLSTGRNHDKHVVALKVKALSPPLHDPTRRAPIDLVMVLDVGVAMTGAKFHMLKRSMRQLISSLTAADRLSLVAFASTAKRLLPLRKMTPQGQRSARRIVDRLVSGHGTGAVGDALRKATRILEDRRERNPVASIMLLSDGQQSQNHNSPPSEKVDTPRYQSSSLSCRSSSTTSSAGTRFAHIEIPVSASAGEKTAPEEEAPEDAFARCVGGLLSVVVHDVSVQLSFPSGEITAVYSVSGQPTATMGSAGIVRLGDLYAEEERDLLVEIKVPATDQQGVLNARCNYKIPVTQEEVESEKQILPVGLAVVPRHQSLLPRSPRKPSSIAMSPKAERLRNLFVTTRAVTEARRLTGLNDTATALHLLSSARSLLLQSTAVSADENLRVVEAELNELQRRRQRRRREGEREVVAVPVAENAGAEALTPTSARRAAERLAKLAIMRKSLNRVSDLHGFEDARF